MSRKSEAENAFAVKRGLFVALVVVLCATIAILCVVSSVGTAPPPTSPGAEPVSDAEVEEGKLLINDMYDGEITIPSYAIPLNTYEAAKFHNDNGLITYEDENARLGIDVSEFQGDIDWNAVKESGVDFAIIRCGYRGATRGKLNEDSNFEANFAGAKNAGLDVGVYFFSQATTVAEAEEEAGYVLQMLQGKNFTYPVVFDWEVTEVTGSRTASVNGEQMTSFAAAFCKKISKAGFKPCVYFNRSQGYYQYNLQELKGFDFWLAEYTRMPAFYYNFDMWQYSDNAEVRGISTAVDINISFKPYR